MYSLTDRNAVDALRAKATHLAGFRPSNLQRDRVVVRYEVREHAWGENGLPIRWGVWPVWAYADRPDLGASFGGPFVPLSDLGA